jgi:hypothetical protein
MRVSGSNRRIGEEALTASLNRNGFGGGVEQNFRRLDCGFGRQGECDALRARDQDALAVRLDNQGIVLPVV